MGDFFDGECRLLSEVGGDGEFGGRAATAEFLVFNFEFLVNPLLVSLRR